MVATKTCSRCAEDLPLASFGANRRNVGGLHGICRACRSAEARDYRARNYERVRAKERRHKGTERSRKVDADGHRWRKFGLSPEAFAAMELACGGRCSSCRDLPTRTRGGKHRLHVDHDHATGRVRGLLCGRCNQALGLLRDSPLRIDALRAYVDRCVLTVVRNG